MLVLVLSDIHANLPALEAVLGATAPVDAVWVLGDTVGYGAQPDGVVSRLQAIGARAVRGNHDAAAVGDLDTAAFNPDARAALDWTRETMTSATHDWLAGLPERRVEEGVTLVHGSPRDPLWEYLVSTTAARSCFPAFETRHCLVGHTHVPLVFRQDDGLVEVLGPSHATRLALDDRRCIVNPGSVGQPRDGDARASCLLLDSVSLEVQWRRVPYDIERTQEHMRAAALPESLVRRLEYGA